MDKPWHICASNAVTGEGLHEGVEILFYFIFMIKYDLHFQFCLFSRCGMVDLTNQRHVG